MAVGATGTPTVNHSIPTYATGADAPSGQGFNSAMAFIDTLLLGAPFASKITSIAAGDVPVWNGSAWVRPSGSRDGTKFLRDDGAWAAAGGSAPSGVVLPYGGLSSPSADWLLADGTAYSRTTYAALFGVYSTRFGVGDGSTTFNIPDLRGRSVFGLGTHADVSTVGNNDGVAVGNRRPKHRHTVNDPTHRHPIGASAGGGSLGAGGGAGTLDSFGSGGFSSTGITIGTASDALDAPPYLVLNWLIKT